MKTKKKQIVFVLSLLVAVLALFPATAQAADDVVVIESVVVERIDDSTFSIGVDARITANDGHTVKVTLPDFTQNQTGSIKDSGGMFYSWPTAITDVYVDGASFRTEDEEHTIIIVADPPENSVFITFTYAPPGMGISADYIADLMRHRITGQMLQTDAAITETEDEYYKKVNTQYDEAAALIKQQGYTVETLKDNYYVSANPEELENIREGPLEETTDRAALYPETEKRLRENEAALLQEFMVNAASDFTTDHYHTDIVVNEDGSFDITETIDVTFLEPQYGIEREISQSGQMVVPEGDALREWKFNMRVSNVSVDDWNYTVQNSHFFDPYRDVAVSVGDESLYVQGKQQYVIRHTSKMPIDPFNDSDYIHQYLFPSAWREPIQSATATIHLPAHVDIGDIQVLFEDDKLYESNGIDVQVQDNRIDVRIKAPLRSYSGVALDVKLPNEYFKYSEWQATWDKLKQDFVIEDSKLPLAGFAAGIAGRDLTAREILFLYISILILLISFVVWLCTGCNFRKPLASVELSPPNDMNPAEMGYVLDGSVDAKDIAGLIIYWAGKGYIKIEPSDHEKNVFRLTKIKTLPDTAKKYEHSIFDGLFAYGDAIYSNEFKKNVKLRAALRSASAELVTQYWKTKAGTTLTMENVMYGSRNDKTSKGLRGWAMVLQVIALAFFAWQVPLVIAGAAGFAWYYISYAVAMRSYAKSAKQNSHRVARMIVVGAMCFAMAAIMGCFVYGSLFYAVVLTIASLPMVVMSANCRKRTKYGNEQYGRIMGFRRFIQTVEHQKAVLFAKEDPSVVYDVLAYAYVLDVTRVWVKHFETFDMPGLEVVMCDFDAGTAVFHNMMHMHIVQSSGHSRHVE